MCEQFLQFTTWASTSNWKPEKANVYLAVQAELVENLWCLLPRSRYMLPELNCTTATTLFALSASTHALPDCVPYPPRSNPCPYHTRTIIHTPILMLVVVAWSGKSNVLLILVCICAWHPWTHSHADTPSCSLVCICAWHTFMLTGVHLRMTHLHAHWCASAHDTRGPTVTQTPLHAHWCASAQTHLHAHWCASAHDTRGPTVTQTHLHAHEPLGCTGLIQAGLALKQRVVLDSSSMFWEARARVRPRLGRDFLLLLLLLLEEVLVGCIHRFLLGTLACI